VGTYEVWVIATLTGAAKGGTANMNQDTIVAPARRKLVSIAGRLAEWLAARIPMASKLVVNGLSYPSGAGLSNETILFEANWMERGIRRSEGCVLRLKPGSYRVYLELNFETQFKLQRALFDAGVPVPETFWFEPDSSLFGAPFFVMKRLRGRAAMSFPPFATQGWVAEASVEQRLTIWHNAIDALAELHHAPAESISILNKPHLGATGWEQEWIYWIESRSWARGNRVLPTWDRTMAWLRANMPVDRRSGLCWGDARIGNLMFGSDFKVLAIMDWEGASLRGSFQDLGYWLVLDDVMATASGIHPEGFGSREEHYCIVGKHHGRVCCRYRLVRGIRRTETGRARSSKARVGWQ